MSFQAAKTWKQPSDLGYAAKKAQVEHPYAIADGEAVAGPGDPDVVVCVDEFGPLNPQPAAREAVGPPRRCRQRSGKALRRLWATCRRS